ncbi:MAG: sodium:proton antiporter [Thaumarchaeota archaeon]|nr:sodium:proton antiporter [Nitrososphaerota archaeon]
MLAAFLALIVASAVLSRKSKLPYTLVLVFIGVGFTGLSALGLGKGLIPASINSVFTQIDLAYGVLVSNGIFVGLVVPPLIFAAMIHIRAVDLKAVVRPSVVLATAGVLVATLVGGVMMWYIAGLPPMVSFLISAILAPTDVVTVLEVFQRVRAPSELAAMLDLEAALNDATAIVVFSVIIASASLPGFPILSSLLLFLVKLGGGVLVGLAVGFAAEAIASQLQDRVLVTMLTISVVYGAYALSTGLGASGLVAVAVAGLYFGNLTLAAWIGPSTRASVVSFWEVAAFLGTSVAFLFIGFQVDFATFFQSVPLIVLAFLSMAASRAATVYPILAVFQKIGQRMPSSWASVTFLSGMRGALSIALAASVGGLVLFSASDINTINSVVLGVAFLSLTIQVPLLYRYVRSRFEQEQKVSKEEIEKAINDAIDSIIKSQLSRNSGAISEEEFVAQAEEKLASLNDSLQELASTIETRRLLRARASQLYRSIVGRRVQGPSDRA